MITPGTILVQKGTLLPPAFRPGSEPYPHAWVSVKGGFDSYYLEKEFAALGWTFHYMAGKVKASAFGSDRQRATQKALSRLIAGAVAQKCNCLEIDEVETHSYLGVPRVSVCAHSRDIQKQTPSSGTHTPDQAAPPDAAATAAVALP